MKKSTLYLLFTLALSIMTFPISKAMDFYLKGEAPATPPVKQARRLTLEQTTIKGSDRNTEDASMETLGSSTDSFHESVCLPEEPSTIAKRFTRFFKIVPSEILLQNGKIARSEHAVELRKQRWANKIAMLRRARLTAEKCFFQEKPYIFIDSTWAQLPRTTGFVFVINNTPYFIPTHFAEYLTKNFNLPINLSRPLTYVYVEFPKLFEHERNFILHPSIVTTILHIMLVGMLDEENPHAHIGEEFFSKLDLWSITGAVVTRGSKEFGSEDAVQEIIERAQTICLTHV